MTRKKAGMKWIKTEQFSALILQISVFILFIRVPL